MSIISFFLVIKIILIYYCFNHLHLHHSQVQAIKITSIMGQAISSSQFFLYGKRHFTETGYLRHVQKYTEPVQKSAAICIGDDGADGVDLTGRVIVVTGANSGVGKEIATYCAAKNAKKVYLLCRSQDRAISARDEIVLATKRNVADINILLADVGELAQVRKVVLELQGKESKVDALVCNAGVLLNEKKETSEGNEVTFASHLLGGTYLLAKLLTPQLEAAGDQARIIITSSGGMYNYKLPNWDVLTSKDENVAYDGNSAYAYAKRGQVLLAERWSKEFPKLVTVTCHPGWSATPAVDEAYGNAKKYLEPLRTPWQGAEGICWLLGTDRKNLTSGELYLDRSIEPKHLAGPFFSEGSHTKNTPQEVDEFMQKLKEVTGV